MTRSFGERFRQWSPVIVGLVVLLAGTGWLQYLLERQDAERVRQEARQDAEHVRQEAREEAEHVRQKAGEEAERARYRSVYENFLVPFQSILDQTDVIFADLEDPNGLGVEDRAELFNTYIEQLDVNQATRALWRARINSLISENKRAMDLVNRFEGSILDPDFRDACAQFRQHVAKREDHWEAIRDQGTATFRLATLPPTPRFPAQLREALDKEIDLVREKAGLY